MATPLHTSIASSRPLTVYAAGPGSLMKSLVADFQEYSSARVNLFQATTGKVLSRLEAEAENPQADVFISASWDLAQELDARGWLQAYESDYAAQVPAHLKTPRYIAQAVSALGIVWNRDTNTPEPRDWQDLASPVFNGLINMPDPASSGASVDLLLGLKQAIGDGAWELFARLKKNGMEICGANDQALAPVLRGSKAAVFGSVDYVAYAAVEKGAPIKVIFPQSGTVIVPRPMMILKNARQPQLAREFIDYLLSDDGQAGAAAAWLMPARSDIITRRPSINDIRLLPQGNLSETSRARSLEKFSDVFFGG